MRFKPVTLHKAPTSTLAIRHDRLTSTLMLNCSRTIFASGRLLRSLRTFRGTPAPGASCRTRANANGRKGPHLSGSPSRPATTAMCALRTGGVDVELPFLIANANGASGP